MNAAIAPATWERCRLCKGRLKAGTGDDVVRGVCALCSGRPEAAKLVVATNGRAPGSASSPPRPRPFTDADRSLIRAMHGYLPAAELLRILNERMAADLGPGAPAYTLEQLHRAVQDVAGGAAGADDWTSLRRQLAQARASGVLATITAEVLDDFCVVFGLSPGQATHLRDVIRHAQEPRP